MKTKKKINSNVYYDIVIVGGGPIGLAFACGFANTNLKIAIVDKLSKKSIQNPKIDGREVALTHHSVNILKKFDVWKLIPKKLISPIKEARVLDGDYKYFLNFAHSEIMKDCLGYIVPNYIIKKFLYKKLNYISNITLIDKAECVSVETSNQNALLKLSNKKNITSSLVVAADSRFSKLFTTKSAFFINEAPEW